MIHVLRSDQLAPFLDHSLHCHFLTCRIYRNTLSYLHRTETYAGFPSRSSRFFEDGRVADLFPSKSLSIARARALSLSLFSLAFSLSFSLSLPLSLYLIHPQSLSRSRKFFTSPPAGTDAPPPFVAAAKLALTKSQFTNASKKSTM